MAPHQLTTSVKCLLYIDQCVKNLIILLSWRSFVYIMHAFTFQTSLLSLSASSSTDVSHILSSYNGLCDCPRFPFSFPSPDAATVSVYKAGNKECQMLLCGTLRISHVPAQFFLLDCLQLIKQMKTLFSASCTQKTEGKGWRVTYALFTKPHSLTSSLS